MLDYLAYVFEEYYNIQDSKLISMIGDFLNDAFETAELLCIVALTTILRLL